YCFVVRRFCVVVSEQNSDRRACGFIIENTAEQLWLVIFLSWRGTCCSGLSTIKIFGKIFCDQGNSCRTSIDDDAYCRSVAFAKNRNTKYATQRIHQTVFLNSE